MTVGPVRQPALRRALAAAEREAGVVKVAEADADGARVDRMRTCTA